MKLVGTWLSQKGIAWDMTWCMNLCRFLSENSESKDRRVPTAAGNMGVNP